MKKPLYEVKVPMRYGDMDVNKHINNVNVFRYFEEGRVQWLSSLGIVADGKKQGPVVAETRAKFLTELNYPGTLIVRAFLKKLGNSSYILEQQIVREDDADVVAIAGEVVMVWFDHEAKTSVPLPAEIREVLAASA